MTETQRTFGEFFDEVRRTESIEGQVWMDDWKDAFDESRWQELRQSLLTHQQVISFAEGMVEGFQDRMQSICTDALYSSTLQSGHAFLSEIRTIALRFEIDVGEIVEIPITPTEAVVQAQRAENQSLKEFCVQCPKCKKHVDLGKAESTKDWVRDNSTMGACITRCDCGTQFDFGAEDMFEKGSTPPPLGNHFNADGTKVN